MRDSQVRQLRFAPRTSRAICAARMPSPGPLRGRFSFPVRRGARPNAVAQTPCDRPCASRRSGRRPPASPATSSRARDRRCRTPRRVAARSREADRSARALRLAGAKARGLAVTPVPSVRAAKPSRAGRRREVGARSPARRAAGPAVAGRQPRGREGAGPHASAVAGPARGRSRPVTACRHARGPKENGRRLRRPSNLPEALFSRAAP